MKSANGAGFTLVELLVSVAIMIFIIALFFFNLRGGEKQLALSRVVQRFSQDVNRTAELALRAQYTECAIGRISGYGMYVSSDTPSSYLLFVECSDNEVYNPGLDDVVETVQLERGIQIDSVEPIPSMSIVFFPPVPTVFLNPGNQDQLRVTFGTRDDVHTKSILVNNRGAVDIE